VEILTSKSVEPSKAWLDIVKTSRARAKISHWIAAKEGDRTREMGRQVLESELLRHGRALGLLIENGTISNVAKRFNFSSANSLIEAIGFGKFPVRKVVTQLVPPQDLRRASGRGSAKPRAKTKKKSGKAKSRAGKPVPEKTLFRETQPGTMEFPTVVIRSFNDSALAFGPCCSPLVDDEVAAVRKDDQVVEVHLSDCKRILEAHPERIMPARLAEEVEGKSEVTIEVVSEARKGMLAKISSQISAANLNIIRALVHTTEEKKAIHSFSISIKRLSDLRRIIKAIEKIDGIISVRRMVVPPQ